MKCRVKTARRVTFFAGLGLLGVLAAERPRAGGGPSGAPASADAPGAQGRADRQCVDPRGAVCPRPGRDHRGSPRRAERADAGRRHRLLPHRAGDRPHRFGRDRRAGQLECPSPRALAGRCGAGLADRRRAAGEGDRQRLGLAVHGARGAGHLVDLSADGGRGLRGAPAAGRPGGRGVAVTSGPARVKPGRRPGGNAGARAGAGRGRAGTGTRDGRGEAAGGARPVDRRGHGASRPRSGTRRRGDPAARATETGDCCGRGSRARGGAAAGRDPAAAS